MIPIWLTKGGRRLVVGIIGSLSLLELRYCVKLADVIEARALATFLSCLETCRSSISSTPLTLNSFNCTCSSSIKRREVISLSLISSSVKMGKNDSFSDGKYAAKHSDIIYLELHPSTERMFRTPPDDFGHRVQSIYRSYHHGCCPDVLFWS